MAQATSKEPIKPQRGMWFEDFSRDALFRSPSRTVTEADIYTFGGLTGDLYELHTSEEYARQTEFGSRIAHGMLGLAIMHGLICRTGHVEGTGVAMIGWDRIVHKLPIRIGDTVHSRWHAITLRESRSRPDTGIVSELIELINQRGETVLQGEYTSMVRKRPA